MNGKRNATGTVVYDQITTSVQCKIIDDSCLLQANMASHVHSHQHLMGPALMAGCPRWNLGAYAKNGVPSPQIFRFNHWVTPVGLIIKPLSCCVCMCVCVCLSRSEVINSGAVLVFSNTFSFQCATDLQSLKVGLLAHWKIVTMCTWVPLFAYIYNIVCASIQSFWQTLPMDSSLLTSGLEY